MRLCSDTGILRRQRMFDGGAAAGVLLGAILLAHAIWPMQTWKGGGFGLLLIALLAVGGYVAIKPRRDGRYACFDDNGVSVQAGWRTRRLTWPQVLSAARQEIAMDAYRLEFGSAEGALVVNLTAFADETAVVALLKRHLPWVDTEQWNTRPSIRPDS